MSEVTLTVETGRTTGTRPSRRLRAEGRIPGVIYGGGGEATQISFLRSDLRTAMTTEAGQNALVTMRADGDEFLTVVKEVQRHPVRRDVIHVDFLKIDSEKPIELEVPIRLVGEAKKVTVNGGMTEQRLNSLLVRVRPDAIPNAIEVDISVMTLDRSLLVKDLELPEGVVSLSKPQQAVVTAELTRAAVTARSEGAADDAEAE